MAGGEEREISHLKQQAKSDSIDPYSVQIKCKSVKVQLKFKT